MIYDLPFFYDSFEAADAVMDGSVGDHLFERLKEGRVSLDWPGGTMASST